MLVPSPNFVPPPHTHTHTRTHPTHATHVPLSAVSLMVMKHDGTQPGPTLGLAEMVGDTVLVAVADEDSDTVVLTELDTDLDGDGDGDGLQPVMFTVPESSTRSRPPTMSSSVVLAIPVPGPPATVSQLAKAGKPGQAEGTHCCWRQVTYSGDMPSVLYRLTVDRTPPAKAPVGVYVALPEALQVATCWPMTMHPAEVEKAPSAVKKSTASRGFLSTTTSMKPSEKATMIKCLAQIEKRKDDGVNKTRQRGRGGGHGREKEKVNAHPWTTPKAPPTKSPVAPMR